MYLGGLGFGLKWNMGWMHDTLKFFQTDPLFRRHHFNQITFSIWYAFTENFVLALSHDEVVHGKGSLIGKMPGDEWQQFANLRLLYGYMWGHPGKKLIFMGCEFGQKREWQHDGSLEWDVLQYPLHAGVQRWVRDLNFLYRETPALFEQDFAPEGFEWVDCNDADSSVLSFLRKDRTRGTVILVICNFTPVVRSHYRVGVPRGGTWRERLNSDATVYGGSGQGNAGVVQADDHSTHGRPHSLTLTLPPLGVLLPVSAMTAVWPGNPYPRGATWDGEGVNFSLFSENATRVQLCLFDASGRHEVQRIDLTERTDQIWHCYLPEARPGLLYGYRCHGPYDPERGHRFNPQQAADRALRAAARGPHALERCPFRLRRGGSRPWTCPSTSATARRARPSAASSIRPSPGEMTVRRGRPGMTRSSTSCTCAA